MTLWDIWIQVKTIQRQTIWQRKSVSQTSHFFCEIQSLRMLILKKGLESSQREKTTHCSFQHPCNWGIGRKHWAGKSSREIHFSPTKHGHSNLNKQEKTQGEEKRKHKRLLLTRVAGYALGRQEREPYGAAQPYGTHSVSLVLESSMRLFLVFLQKRTPDRSSSFPFVHLCFNSKGLVKLVSKDVS